MSKSAFNILGFHFSASDYALAAKSLFSVSERKSFERSIKSLESIAEKCIVSDEPLPDRIKSEEVYKRFCIVYKDPGRGNFSSRELRMLTYSMHLVKNVPLMNALVGLLDNHWKDRYLNGLLYFVLSNWDDTNVNVMSPVLDLMRKHLSSYQGKRDKYLILKNNIRFLCVGGPELLGLTLRQIDRGPNVACSLYNISSMYFGLSKDRLDMQFYSKVIVAYFEKDGLFKPDLMEKILRVHNYAPTAKRLIPAIILGGNKMATDAQREAIKTLAVNEIGDPSESSHWKLPIGTQEEKDNLEEARDILDKWIKRKFIAIFFEKCVQDPRRKKFWLEHASIVNDFEIYCTERTKAVLLQDSRISQLVNRKVVVLSEKTNSEFSALGMSIGSYYFIEFSERGSGSIYIYGEKIRNPRYFYQLKKPHLPTMQSFMMCSGDCKLPHLPDWEKTLTKWFMNNGVL